MKTKMMKLINLIMMFILVTGCSNIKDQQTDTLYETELIGEWNQSKQGDGLYLSFDKEICTWEEYSGYYTYGEYTNNKLNNNINEIYVKLSDYSNLHIYKFYNMLGNYYELEDSIPSSETFDYTLRDVNIEYSFNSDGSLVLYSIFDEQYTEIISYNYYIKENIIYNKDTDDILFYIIENGLFNPQYYKAEE